MYLVNSNCQHYSIKILKFIIIVPNVMYLEPLIVKCGMRLPIYVYPEYIDILYTIHISVTLLYLITVYTHTLNLVLKHIFKSLS